MKQKTFLVSLLPGLLLAGCSLTRTPTSTYPNTYSLLTGLPTTLADSLTSGYQQKGWRDDRVLLFNQKACVESFAMTPLVFPAVARADELPAAPGVVLVTNEGLGIDEVEIPNREWRLYLLAQRQAGVAPGALRPRATALPVPDYFTNRFYDFYPVVGISYEQAQAFCRWRSQAASAALNRGTNHTDTLAAGYVRATYRLPTEAEWEHAALVMSNLPFGTSCPQLPVRVRPGAAAYLKQRSGSLREVTDIRADIIAYNQTKPVRNCINCAQAEPYFLASPTPGYVYQGPSNAYGLYQMLGNVAELVQEKGITKGGSHRDAPAACRIKARGRYSGPAPDVGFRTVATVSRPNRPGGR